MKFWPARQIHHFFPASFNLLVTKFALNLDLVADHRIPIHLDVAARERLFVSTLQLHFLLLNLLNQNIPVTLIQWSVPTPGCETVLGCSTSHLHEGMLRDASGDVAIQMFVRDVHVSYCFLLFLIVSLGSDIRRRPYRWPYRWNPRLSNFQRSKSSHPWHRWLNHGFACWRTACSMCWTEKTNLCWPHVYCHQLTTFRAGFGLVRLRQNMSSTKMNVVRPTVIHALNQFGHLVVFWGIPYCFST